MKKLIPPKHLRPATRRWWRSVVEQWDLDEHHIRLLTLACESWDRAAEARELIAAAGLVTVDRFGQTRVHPAVSVERDSRTSFARLLRELDLDLDPPAESSSRPPSLRSIAR